MKEKEIKLVQSVKISPTMFKCYLLGPLTDSCKHQIDASSRCVKIHLSAAGTFLACRTWR